MKANIPSLLMVQPNKANSATLNESPAVETEIEKEKKKKVQCQHCSNLFTTEYIERHVQKCSKNFEKRRDVNQHIGHHHKEVQFTLDISYFQVYSGYI